MRLTDNMMAILTLLAGGALTQGGALLQRHWSKQDEQRAEERRRDRDAEAARAARADAMCHAILEEVERIHVVLQTQEPTEAIPDGVHPSIERINRQVVLVRDPELRQRLDRVIGLIYWANQVAYEVPYEPVIIAWWAANYVNDVAGALLREEDPPSEPDWLRQWIDAYERVGSVGIPMPTVPRSSPPSRED